MRDDATLQCNIVSHCLRPYTECSLPDTKKRCVHVFLSGTHQNYENPALRLIMLIICWPHVFLSTKYCGVPMFTCEFSISSKSYLLPKLLCGFKMCHRRANACTLSGKGYVYGIDTFIFFITVDRPLSAVPWNRNPNRNLCPCLDKWWARRRCHQTFGHSFENNIAWFGPEKGGTIATTSGLREGWYHICFYIKLFRWIFRSMGFRHEQ